MSETEKERGAEMEEKAKEPEGSMGRGLHQGIPPTRPRVWPSVRALGPQVAGTGSGQVKPRECNRVDRARRWDRR